MSDNNSQQSGEGGNGGGSPGNLSLAVIGGLTLASALTINLMFTGKLIKPSEMFYTAFRRREEADYRNWKFSVFLGLIIATSYYYLFVDAQAFNPPEKFLGYLSIMGYGLAGVLIGFGSQLAGGCTSVFFCGLPKWGKRFILEALLITLSATSIANVTKNTKLPSILTTPSFTTIASEINLEVKNLAVFGGSICLAVYYIVFLAVKNRTHDLKGFFIHVLSGFLYGLGFILTGMIKPSKVLGLLSFDSLDDFELIISIAVVVGMNFLTFYWIYHVDNLFKYPILGGPFDLQEWYKISTKNILGCIIFGIGWGMCGICPGCAIMTCYLYLPHMALFLMSVFVGQEIAMKVEREIE